MLKLQSNSKALKNALNISARNIAKKNTLSILDNVLLSKAEGQLMFISATSDSRLTTKSPFSVVSGEFTTPIALPINSIMSFISMLPDCVINLTISDNNSLLIEYCIGTDDKLKTGKASLVCLSGEDFPQLPCNMDSDYTSITMSGGYFSAAITNAIVFACKEDLRPTMSSLCIDIAADKSRCSLVSTDGRTLIRTTCPDANFTHNSGSIRECLIHRSYFSALQAFDGCDNVTIDFDKNILHIESDDMDFVCKAVEGKYPNYTKVIPAENPYYLTFNKSEFLETIKRVSVFGSNTTPLVKVRKDGMFLIVSACDNDYSTNSSEQVFLIDSNCVEGLEFGADPNNLINIIKVLDADVICMKLSDPTRPVITVPDGATPFQLTLTMPMLIG